MKNINSFKEEGFVKTKYPKRLLRAVLSMEKSWRTFCTLPEETKIIFPYSKESAGVGYELKNKQGDTLDLKENFNFTLKQYQWLLDSASNANVPEFLDLIEKCKLVATEIQPEIDSFSKDVENEFGIAKFRKEVAESKDIYYIRLIHYFGDREVGDEIATAHTDKSGFTLHLYENTSGLQRLTYGGDWVNLPISSGHTQIIPNMQLQYKTRGELKATCHRVVATKESSKNGRFSAVCFVMLKNTPRYNKELSGRLQEKMSGFNYTQSHNSFSKLFKD